MKSDARTKFIFSEEVDWDNIPDDPNYKIVMYNNDKFWGLQDGKRYMWAPGKQDGTGGVASTV